MSEQIQHGGCLCGAIRYQATGTPVAAYVCHCSYCQRSSGTAFQMPVFFRVRQVQFSGDTPQTFDYVSPLHGRTITTQFCGRCGTRIGSRISRVPGVQIISAGTFDPPYRPDITCHLFAEHRLPWVRLPADTPCYAQHFVSEQGETQAAMVVEGGS